MDLEHTLSDLLEESVGDLQPPVAEMVVAANRLGGRRRARRRVQLAGAVVAVAALATAGTVAGLDRQQPAHATELTVAAAPKASPSVSPTATPTAAAGPMTDLTWQAMLQILAEEVPPGGTYLNLDTSMIKFDTAADRRGLTVQYDDGQGAVTVSVDIARTVGRQVHTCTGWHGGDEGPRRPGYEAMGCFEKTLPDGTQVMSYVTGVDSYGLYDESVVIVRSNGEMLHITSANATLNALGSKPPITVTRDRPPLGLQGWERVIESPKWQFQVPQSLADQGAAFARTVTRLPCPQPKDCVS